MIINYIIVAIVGYVLGSIPSAVWIGKIFFKTDVRDHGSGNAGATNTFRVLGWKPGILVFFIDGLKGFAAVHIVPLILTFPTDHIIYLQITVGMAAVIGHIYPLFAQFNGGKGVATMLGIIIALQVYAALIALGVFIIVLVFTRFVSLGSLLSGFSYAVMCSIDLLDTHFALKVFSIILFFVLIISHIDNIKRLIKNEENKINFTGKRD